MTPSSPVTDDSPGNAASTGETLSTVNQPRLALYHADCFEVLERLAPGSVDAIISDPPYGVTALPWDRRIDWPRFWSEAHRVCKQNAVIVLFSAQPFTTDLIASNRSEFRYELIWHKRMATGWLDAKRRPLRAHENVLVFAPRFAQSAYVPQMEGGHKPYRRDTAAWKVRAPHYRYGRRTSVPDSGVSSPNEYAPLPSLGADEKPGEEKPGNERPENEPPGERMLNREKTDERYPRSVLTFPERREIGLHPTQKPLALMEWLVLTYTHTGDTVLDPFMGSGTTGEACLRHDRPFIGVEKEGEYFEKARRRLEAVATLQ